MTDLLIENLAEIATPSGTTPRRGAEQGQVSRRRAGADGAGVEILCRDGRLAFVGTRSERQRLWGELPEVPRLDGRRGTAVPGFVDAHTHLPWAGSREDEFVQRLAGGGGGARDRLELLQLVAEREAVAALGLGSRRAAGEHPAEPAEGELDQGGGCLLYTSPSPRD